MMDAWKKKHIIAALMHYEEYDTDPEVDSEMVLALIAEVTQL